MGLKTRITALLVVLLAAGMLLTNLVVVMLWQRDSVRQEVAAAKVILGHTIAGLPKEATPWSIHAESFISHDTDCILFQPDLARLPLQAGLCANAPELSDALSEASQAGEEIVRFSGTAWGVFSFRKQGVMIARPLFVDDHFVGTIGIARSLDPLFFRLQSAEKTVLVYLLINLLVLAVIGFFRMSRLVVRPIERLVNVSDHYRDADGMLFAVSEGGNEFGQLSASLNSMLARIEEDKKKLRETVDELAEANGQLKTSQQEMVRTEKMASVGRLAAGLAHEIGNPLGIVQGYLSLLGRPDTRADERPEFIGRAEKELQRVNTLIRQLLDFSRPTTGQPEQVSIHDLLRSVIAMVKPQALFEEIRIDEQFQAAHDILYTDPDRLRQVVLNCLLNAADAIHAKGKDVAGEIVLSTDLVDAPDGDERKQVFRIGVTDNGSGVAEATLANVFDPFFTTKEPGKGTGLGLSVSLSIIESMGGQMTMESEEGKGSVVTMLLGSNLDS